MRATSNKAALFARRSLGLLIVLMPDPIAETSDLKNTSGRRISTGSTHPVDRLPPHSSEAEQGVLGCILLSPNDCIGECIAKLKGGSEVFYDRRHQTLFDLLAEMFDKREAIDLVTLNERLKQGKLSEAVGGISYVAELPDTVPSAANLTYYLNIVQEKYLLRRMIRVCTEVVGRAYDYEGEFELQLFRSRTWSRAPSLRSRIITSGRAC